MQPSLQTIFCLLSHSLSEKPVGEAEKSPLFHPSEQAVLHRYTAESRTLSLLMAEMHQKRSLSGLSNPSVFARNIHRPSASWDVKRQSEEIKS